MKILIGTLSLIFAVGLAACSAVGPFPRDQLAENIVPILEIEERFDQVKNSIKVLGSLGRINGEILKKMKGHSDIYYVYYWASAVHLAGGDVKSYLAHVKLAEKELEALEVIVKDGLSDDEEPKSSLGRVLPRSEL